MFFQPHVQQRAHAEWLNRKFLTGRDDACIQAADIFGLDPDFITQITTIGDAVHHGGNGGNCRLPVIHELESFVGYVFVGQPGQNLLRVGTGNRETKQAKIDVSDPHRTIIRQVLFKPAHVIDLRLA